MTNSQILSMQAHMRGTAKPAPAEHPEPEPKRTTRTKRNIDTTDGE